MIREIKIKAVLNGYVVNVGCQTLVFSSRQSLIAELDSYLERPDVVEKKYRETALNKDLLNQAGTECQAPLANDNLRSESRPTRGLLEAR